VLIGHSERRQLFLENDEVLGDKLAMALAAGLGVVYCVGETLEQREAGKALETCAEQLSVFVKALGKAGDTVSISRIVVAYEPIWAIGTGKSAGPDEAQDIHASLRRFLDDELAGVAGWNGADIRLLYGGSVKPGNAMEFFRQPDIDGALVGGASLDADKFIDILRMADALTGD
jgi:triosephosphate isomerase